MTVGNAMETIEEEWFLCDETTEMEDREAHSGACRRGTMGEKFQITVVGRNAKKLGHIGRLFSMRMSKSQQWSPEHRLLNHVYLVRGRTAGNFCQL